MAWKLSVITHGRLFEIERSLWKRGAQPATLGRLIATDRVGLDLWDHRICGTPRAHQHAR
ncbi:MAG: hypothetical protein QOE55_4154 [Acidobacteriaceae bacterium]|nr:hypothetical protein [Acidobacteriaceae bacterium]